MTTYDSANGWKNLTLREMIGQTMLMLPDRTRELEIGDGSLEKFFARYPVTGYFMGWMLFDGVEPAGQCKRQIERIVEYNAISKVPLVFQQDYESGVDLPGFTRFPNAMTLGAANSTDLAYRYGEAVAKESRAVGVQWVLHPVADINLNRFNPITNVRCAGDDPDRVISILKAQISGIQDGGVAATIKHFPGDGVDFRDQHLVTTCNSLSIERWREFHGKVFQSLIDDGALTLMPGHITFPAYQLKGGSGLCLPATLSHELISDLLKKEMHFNGVVVSDAMMMGGFRGWYESSLEAEVQSFLAGVDVLLWPSYEFLDEVERRINDGRIPIERLHDAVSRVWELKTRLGVFESSYRRITMLDRRESDRHRNAAVEICEGAVTLVRDVGKRLPLDIQVIKNVCLVVVCPVGRKGGDAQLRALEHTKSLFEERGISVELKHNLLYETDGWTEALTDNFDLVVFLLSRIPHNPFGPLQFFDDEAQSVWGINAMPKEKCIVVSYGDPYLVDEYFKRSPVCINAYTTSSIMQEAVVKALFGEIDFIGTTPVNLDFSWPVDMRHHQ